MHNCLTQMLVMLHRIMNTPQDLTPLILRCLEVSGQRKIVDLCSGSGEPMPGIVDDLRRINGFQDLPLELTRPYPTTKTYVLGLPCLIRVSDFNRICDLVSRYSFSTIHRSRPSTTNNTVSAIHCAGLSVR